MIYDLVIDLHNLYEEEAISKILFALFQLETDDAIEQIKIITGKGLVLRDLTIKLVEEQNFVWEFDGQNYGAIIVFHH